VKVFIKLIASGLFAGYAPIAPGTIGSIWGIIIYLLFYRYPLLFRFITILIFIAGFLISEKAEIIFQKKDSEKIVIDEIASMCLVYIFINPEYLMLITGFILFRVFDIIKPIPARKIEKLSGAKAVMIDDVIAAVYTILSVFVISRLQIMGILPMWYI
jgi:phosphatidylglycerophosphatase A